MELLPLSPPLTHASMPGAIALDPTLPATGGEGTALDFAALLAAELESGLGPGSTPAEPLPAAVDERDTQTEGGRSAVDPMLQTPQPAAMLPAAHVHIPNAWERASERSAPTQAVERGEPAGKALGAAADVAGQAAAIAVTQAPASHAAVRTAAEAPYSEAAGAPSAAAHALSASETAHMPPAEISSDAGRTTEHESVDAMASPAPSPGTAHSVGLAASERVLPQHMAVAVREVAAPVRSPEFPTALSQQVVWMADKDAQVAELRLNPPELGPLEVRLTIAGDEASAQFVSPHAEVRTAIEAALVRLRESLAEAGIALGDASVSAESFRDTAGDAQAGEGGRRSGSAYGETEHVPVARAASSVPLRRGLIDVFA